MDIRGLNDAIDRIQRWPVRDQDPELLRVLCALRDAQIDPALSKLILDLTGSISAIPKAIAAIKIPDLPEAPEQVTLPDIVKVQVTNLPPPDNDTSLLDFLRTAHP